MKNIKTDFRTKPMGTGAYKRAGADFWRKPLEVDDREFFSCATIEIELELEGFCYAAIPLQWFGQADFDVLESAVPVARSLAERDFKQNEEWGMSGFRYDAASPESMAAREKDLQLCVAHHYATLLALILYRTALCIDDPQAGWNSPRTAGYWFGRLLDLVPIARERYCAAYDTLLVGLATAVEMASLPLQEHEEAPVFRDAILLWVKYTEIIRHALSSRGMRLNGATVRLCRTVQQANGCLKLGAHPSTVVTALQEIENDVADFLGLYSRACVTFQISPTDAYVAGSEAGLKGTLPCDADGYDDLLDPFFKADDPRPGPVASGAAETGGPVGAAGPTSGGDHGLTGTEKPV